MPCRSFCCFPYVKNCINFFFYGFCIITRSYLNLICFHVSHFYIYLYDNICIYLEHILRDMDHHFFPNSYPASSTPFPSCIVYLFTYHFELPLIIYTKFIYAFRLLTGPIILFHSSVSLNISQPIIFSYY